MDELEDLRLDLELFSISTAARSSWLPGEKEKTLEARRMCHKGPYHAALLNNNNWEFGTISNLKVELLNHGYRIAEASGNRF